MSDQNIALGIARKHLDKLKESLPQVDTIKSFVATPLPRMQFFNKDRDSLGWMPIPTSAIECHIILYVVESGLFIMDTKEPWLDFYAAMLHDYSKGMNFMQI